MNTEEIREAITQDLNIDRFNLVDEMQRTPKLFSKYLSIWVGEKAKLRMIQRKYWKAYKERREYYSGSANDDVYENEPFDRKIIRQDLEVWLDADEKIQDLKDRMSFQELVVEVLERTLKEINNRNYIIRGMIDVIKFESGA